MSFARTSCKQQRQSKVVAQTSEDVSVLREAGHQPRAYDDNDGLHETPQGSMREKGGRSGEAGLRLFVVQQRGRNEQEASVRVAVRGGGKRKRRK